MQDVNFTDIVSTFVAFHDASTQDDVQDNKHSCFNHSVDNDFRRGIMR